ncbi:MAG: hypothetical protein OHK0029_34470 [Armatimonadaceae bacterium]
MKGLTPIVRSVAGVSLLGGLLLFGASPASAQFSSTPDGARPIHLAPGLRSHFDIFAGNDKPGPYILTWNNLRVSREETVEVVVDGETLRDELFKVDAAKGTITFTRPIKTSSVVRVRYYYDPAASRRNGGVAATPMTVPLLRMGGNSLKVTALPKNDAESSGFSAPLAFSTGGKSNAVGGNLVTRFDYAGEDSLGMDIDFKRGNARNGLDFSFYRADDKLVQRFGGTLNYRDPARRMNLGTRLAPFQWFTGTFSRNENEDFKKNVETANNNLALRLGGIKQMPTLAYTQTDNKTDHAKKGETTVRTEKLDFDARLGGTTRFEAVGVRSQTDGPTTKKDVSTDDRTLRLTSGSKDNKAQAVVALEEGTRETRGAIEERNNLTLRLQATPQFIVSATRRDQTVTPLKPDGERGDSNTVTAQTLQADIVPMPGTKLVGSVSETARNDVAATEAALSAQWGNKTLQVSTGMTNRATEEEGVDLPDTTHASVELRPSKTVVVTGGLTWNPEDRGRVTQAQRQELGLKANLGAWQVQTNYSLTTLNGLNQWDDVDPQIGQVALTLGIRLGNNTNFNTRYTDTLRYRSADELPAHLVGHYTRIIGFGFAHNMGEGFNLSLGTTITENRKNAKDPTDIRAEAKLGVRF